MDELLRHWSDVVVWIALAIAILGWYIAKAAWLMSVPLFVTPFISLFISIFLLISVSIFFAMFVIASQVGVSRVLANFFSAFQAFFELGIETAGLWFPVLLLRNAFLFRRDYKNKKPSQEKRSKNNDFSNQIRKLYELKEDGIISSEEFDEKKAQILNRTLPAEEK